MLVMYWPLFDKKMSTMRIEPSSGPKWCLSIILVWLMHTVPLYNVFGLINVDVPIQNILLTYFESASLAYCHRFLTHQKFTQN